MEKGKILLKRYMGYVFKGLIKLTLIFVLFSIIQVVIVRYIDPPFTAPMIGLWISNLFSSKKEVMPDHEWRDLKDISPSLVKAVMAGEDQRFVSHHGFDFVEINNVFKELSRNKNKRSRGASTITMQLSRTLFLWKDRSLIRKAMEAYYTVLLELFLNKRRIIELYLNMVDWGDGIMGAEVASQKYFKIDSDDLTEYQAAQLAAILPNPHDWSPIKPNRYVKARIETILKYMEDMQL